MSGMFSYTGIATKVRGMSSRLLTKEDYIRLASCHDVTEAVVYLRQHTAYAKVLEEIAEGQLHRGEIERVLLHSLQADFQKIYKFASLKQRKVLELYFCKYEIQMLKRVLRGIFNPGARGVGMDPAFRSYSKIDLEQLRAARNIPEFLEALKKTPYYDILARVSQKEDAALFDYEMILDLFYFSHLWKEKNKLLKGKDLELITQIYGNQIDMLNMMWIYRAKQYYQIPTTAIYALVIPISYKLKKVQIQNMAEAESEKDMKKAAQETYYGQRYQDLQERDLEQLYRQLLARIYQVEKRRNPYSISAVTSYLYNKEQEIDQLTTILECVRYGLTTTEALKYIPN